MARDHLPGSTLALAVASDARANMEVLCRIVAGFALLIAAAVILSTPAEAAIFKCVTSAGDTTYTSTPCAQDQSTRRISSNAAVVPGLDCRIAQRLAFETSYRMKKGETSATIYDSYGGLNSLSPLVIGLVNYVYSFEGNNDASASRIATLATEHCQVGSFGAKARHCDTYPYEFIERLGGCSAARGEKDAVEATKVSDS